MGTVVHWFPPEGAFDPDPDKRDGAAEKQAYSEAARGG